MEFIFPSPEKLAELVRGCCRIISVHTSDYAVSAGMVGMKRDKFAFSASNRKYGIPITKFYAPKKKFWVINGAQMRAHTHF